MTLAELVAGVYVETNRPDLVAETQQKICASIFKLHCMEFFFKDIVTSEIVFDASAYIQNVDIYDFPRYRSISYIRKNDPTLASYQQNPTLLPPLYGNTGLPSSLSMGFLKVITPDDILDEYMQEKLDVCYQAGATVFLKSSTALQYALMGWYQFPNLSYGKDADGNVNDETNFDSWVAREYPYAVIYDAASAVLQTIGMTDAARKYDDPKVGLATTQMNLLIMNNIVAQGR